MTTPLTRFAGPYIPRKHEKFRRWAFVFTGRLAQNPAAAGITPEIAAQLTAAYALFSERYDLAQMPSQRTPYAIRAMNIARKSLESMCRTYAQKIKNDPMVSDEVKFALPLHLGRKRRRHVSAPTTRPMLMINGSKSGQHTIRFHDDESGPANRKPRGAASLQLFAYVADRMGMNYDAAEYVGTYTRQPIRVNWPIETAGKTINYIGRWVNARGEEGPWSNVASMQIAFGGAALASIDRAREIAGRAMMQRAAA